MSRKTIHIVLSLLLVPMIALTGCSSKVIEVSGEEMVVNVKTTAAYEGYLNKGPIFTGTVQAHEEVTILSKVSGRIASIPVEVGMKVNKGEPLVTLEDEDLQNITLQSEAAVGVAQSGVAAAKSGYESGVVAAENNLNQAKTTVNQLQNSLEEIRANAEKVNKSLVDAENNLNRTKELFAAGAISKTQLEQAETTLITAEAAYKSVEVTKKNTEDKLVTAQAALKNAKKQLEIAKNNPQVKVSEEQLKQAQAAAEIANHTLKEATITSPITGTIGSINGNVGELVSPQTPVVVVADLSKVSILVYVPSNEINNIVVGDTVQVRTASVDHTSVGTISNISPLDDQGKGYPVEVVVSNPEQKLKTGMISDVMFINKNQENGIILPKTALLEKDEKQFVYKIKENHAVLTEVEIGEKTDSQVLIVNGLQVNDKVATTNVHVLENNVKIIEEY